MKTGNWQNPVRIKVLADGTVQIGVYAGGNWTFTAATSLDVNNESKYPRIRIIKIENGTEIKLNGAQFELYKADASGTVTTSDGTKVSLYKHNLQEIYESGTARDDATGNAIAGEAVTIKLTEAGNYYLKEIKAPDDHYFTEEWTGPIVVTSDMGGQELQQTVINYKNNQAPGVKVGPDGTAKLAGAVIAVFESSEDVTAMNNFMKSNYNPLSPWAAAAVNDAAFMSTHRIVQTATSDANGEFEFENLTDGHTYYMMELVPPENYQLSKTGVNGDYVYYTVVVSNPYNAAAPFTTITSNDADETARLANSHNLSIKNYEKQNILFTKLCNLSGQILKLDGATFEIYKANAAGTAPDLDAGFVDKITASTNGQYSSIMLPAGTYFIEETVTPSIGDTTFDEETGEREGVVTVTMPNSSVRRFYKVELGRNADDTTWDSDNPIWNNATKGKFVLNKISSESTTGKTIWVAATFKMRKWVVSNGEGSWKDAGTFTTDGKGTFTSDFIEPGYYELTEQSAEGYTVVTTPIYLEIGANKITDGSRSAYATIGSGSYSVYRPLEEVIADTPFEPITVENVPKSGLNITKYGVWSGNGVNNKESELLSGVEFELYVKLTEDFTADTAAGKQPAGFPKSASTVDGKASFTNLDQGSYWIKEVSVGSQNNDKYGKDSYTPIAVVLNSSTAVEKTVENEANYGKFRVTKVDADTLAKLDGATFEILKENGDSLSPAQFMTADGQGRYVSPLLPVGSYKLKETGTPNGYSTNKDTIFGPFTVTANGFNDVAAVLENEHDNELKITKKGQLALDDEAAGNITVTAKFALYASEAAAKAATAANPGTGENAPVRQGQTASAVINWTGLKDGTYYLRELEAPSGYLAETDENGNPKVYEITLSNDTNYQHTYEVTNALRGAFKIKKTVTLNGSPIPLEGVVFNVFEYSDATKGSQIGSITTDAKGEADSSNLTLNPGTYLLEEVLQDGMSLTTAAPLTVTIENGKTNTTYFDAPIANATQYGRFTLKKVSSTDSTTPLVGARFQLYRKDAGGNWGQPLESGGKDYIEITNNDGTYTSGLMATGDYKLVEIKAPNSIKDSANHDVNFYNDGEPIEFTITAAGEIALTKENTPYRTLKIVKKSDEQNGSSVLQNAKFKLYATVDGTTKGELIGAEVTTDGEGTAYWDNIAPGKYILEETEAPAGYEKVTEVVDVPEAETINELTYAKNIVDVSVQGRILIQKQAVDGTVLKGAEFKIYKADDVNLENPVDTVTIAETGNYGSSKLLDTGNYIVVETKAPNGYTLDANLLPVKKTVSVNGIQNPTAVFTGVSQTAIDGYTNLVIFQNRTETSIKGFKASIQKDVRIGTNDFGDTAQSEDSLMFKDVTADFKISGLTDGTNELAAEKFVVTDDTFVYQGYDLANRGGYYALTNEQMAKMSYTVDSVTVSKAVNTDTAKKVSAVLEAKVNNQWTTVDTGSQLTDLSTIGTDGVKITMPENAAGFRLSYSGTAAGFTCGDIGMTATFKKRDSDETLPDIRKIINTANLEWEDTRLSSSGAANHQTGHPTDSAEILFNQYDENLPHLALTNQITNLPTSGFFYSGKPINFQTTAKVTEETDESLKHPVMSINLPAYTTLDESKYGEYGVRGIRVRVGGNVLTNFTLSDPITVTDTEGRVSYKYVLDFGENTEWPKGTEIILDYSSIIDLKVPENVISLESQAYIGSGYQLPLTLENKTGMSYLQSTVDSSTKKEDTDIDQKVEANGGSIEGEGLTYLEQPVQLELTANDSLQVLKSIGTEAGSYLGTGQTATVKPADTVYYRLTMVNAGADVKTARFVDILPFNGDSQEFRAMDSSILNNRGSVLPTGDGYEKPTLLSVEGNASGKAVEGYTVYYYVGENWDSGTRASKSTAEDLPMLALKNGGWSGWTTSPADMSQVTAIGVEVTFSDDALLGTGDSYEVTLSMRAPGYTAEQEAAYANAVMINSTAIAVIRDGDDMSNNIIDTSERVGSNMVSANFYITTGSIGDYAFYDDNDNGVQDEGDRPARNVPVTLYWKKNTLNGDGSVNEGEWTEYAKTLTDHTTGKYLFDKLPCNYRTEASKADGSGYDANPENPAWYVGNTYYAYQVVFGIPEHYGATTQYAAGTGDVNHEPLDSNINDAGQTEPIDLELTVGDNGRLVGENNMTIDAGYVKLVSLGDYVWVDDNKNGIQDASEKGLNGVTVNLYKLSSENDTTEGKTPYRTQQTVMNPTTNQNGYYCFTDLPKGYYVVEYDISNVDKVGYTSKYTFTESNKGSSGADSDAKHIMDADGRVQQTDVIHLTADDMTWDAGVTVYSALGGFCFDDQDYDNTQSLYIALPGTVVSLYTIDENGQRSSKPLNSVTVGEDGRYLFDHLEAGRYQLHFDYPDRYAGVTAGIGDKLHDSETRFFDDETLNSGFSEIITLPADTADITHDAGANLFSAVGDYIWHDANKNGLQDAGEAPVEDILVTLQQKKGDGEWETVTTATTDANGLYQFTGIKSSDHYDVSYRVVFGIGRRVSITQPKQGMDTAIDSNALYEYISGLGYLSDPVKPGYGQNDMTIDAGIIINNEPCEVGDYVWYDVNQDGIQDTDETGVKGITVILQTADNGHAVDENQWTTVGTTVTDENGRYLFAGLPAGYYRVGFLIGDPWTVTLSNRGEGADAAALDSDAARLRGEYYFSRSFHLNSGDSDMTWDAGIYRSSDRPTNRVVTRTTRTVTNRTSGTRTSTRTGDSVDPKVLTGLLCLSGVLLAAIAIFWYRKRKKEDAS